MMLRSMYSGISGMRGFQTKLDVIGNNIANVNTYGFKKGRVTFKDMVSQQIQGASSPQLNRGGTNPKQVGLGSQLASIDTIHTQGSLQTTARSLDLGISGDGYFIVNDGPLSYYTRSGNFYLDHHGNLVNADGLYVQGYAANALGEIDYAQLSNLRIATGATIAPNATSNIAFKGNLHAGTEVAPSTLIFDNGDTEISASDLKDGLKHGVMLTTKVVDSLGYTHELKIVAQKTDAGEWQVGYITPTPDPNDNTKQATDPTTNEKLYTFTQIQSNGLGLVFDDNGKLRGPDANGEPQSLTTTTITIQPQQLTLGNDGVADTLTLTLDFSNLSQYGSANSLDVAQIDGNTEGFLEGFDVSATGEISGIYTNGSVQLLGQIALANFSNPDGLTKSGNNLYQVSNNSGIPNIGIPGEDLGAIVGGSLEMSNVDLAEEFTEMIVAQRGFQANTRIITTSDEILQELVNLKR